MTTLTQKRYESVLLHVLNCMSNMSPLDRIAILSRAEHYVQRGLDATEKLGPKTQEKVFTADQLKAAKKLRLDRKGYQ